MRKQILREMHIHIIIMLKMLSLFLEIIRLCLEISLYIFISLIRYTLKNLRLFVQAEMLQVLKKLQRLHFLMYAIDPKYCFMFINHVVAICLE